MLRKALILNPLQVCSGGQHAPFFRLFPWKDRVQMKNPQNSTESGGQYPPFCQISINRQIIGLVAVRGATCSVFSNRKIANNLQISRDTVNIYVQRISGGGRSLDELLSLPDDHLASYLMAPAVPEQRDKRYEQLIRKRPNNCILSMISA